MTVRVCFQLFRLGGLSLFRLEGLSVSKIEERGMAVIREGARRGYGPKGGAML